MRIKLDNNFTGSLSNAVLLASNSINNGDSEDDKSEAGLNYKYKLAISYVFQLLSIIYAEKARLLSEEKLHRQIKFIKSSKEIFLFESTIDFQLKALGIKNVLFSDFNVKIKIKDEYFLDFIRILRKIITKNDLTPELFGYLYEYFQHYELVNNELKVHNNSQLKLDLDNFEYNIVKSCLIRKKQGSFYTPTKLIHRLADSSLAKLTQGANTLSDLLNIKVLDPACGGGNILLKVFNELYSKALNDLNKSINPDNLKRIILKKCIYGVEIDSFACEVTKLTLFLASNSTDHFENIICGNFLIEDLGEYDKNADLTKLFSRDNSKFSLVIGNPPYLNIQNIDNQEKKYYLSKFQSAYRRFDICQLFVEKGLEFLKEGGILAFILPDKFLTQSYAKKIREIILRDHTIREILSFQDKNLFNATVKPIIISIESTQLNKSDTKTVEIFSNEEKANYINQENYLKQYDFHFKIGWNANKQEIIELIQSKSFPLSEICYISWGAQPGDAKKFIFNNPNLVKQELRPFLKLLIRGGNIDKYRISYSGDYILYLTEGDFKLHRPAFNELFESKKIVISEVTAKRGIIAALDTQNYYTNHSVINCIHKKELLNVDQQTLNSRGIRIVDFLDEQSGYMWRLDDQAYTKGCDVNKNSVFNNINLEFVLGIINSRLINFYFKNYLSGELNVFPELVRYLPIFNLGKIDSHQSQVDSYNYEKLKSLLSETINSKDYSFLHNLISLTALKMTDLKLNLKLQNFQIINDILDNAVYRLYGLNKDQIELIVSE